MKAIAIALALFASACVDPKVERYTLTAPSSISPPVPTPAPTPTPTFQPIAMSLNVGPSSPVAGVRAAFNAVPQGASALSAPLAFAWTFGDGEQGSSATETAFHTYGRAGSYLASVTLTDGSGRSGSASAVVNVINPPPPPPPDPPPPAPVPGLSVALTCTPKAAGSSTPCNVTAAYNGVTLPSAAITNTRWDWGDGVVTDPGTPASSHVFASGSFTIFATVSANTSSGSQTTSTNKSLVIP